MASLNQSVIAVNASPADCGHQGPAQRPNFRGTRAKCQYKGSPWRTLWVAQKGKPGAHPIGSLGRLGQKEVKAKRCRVSKPRCRQPCCSDVMRTILFATRYSSFHLAFDTTIGSEPGRWKRAFHSRAVHGSERRTSGFYPRCRTWRGEEEVFPP